MKSNEISNSRFIILVTLHFIRYHIQLRVRLIDLGTDLIDQVRGLIELGIGLRINNDRRTVWAVKHPYPYLSNSAFEALSSRLAFAFGLFTLGDKIRAET